MFELKIFIFLLILLQNFTKIHINKDKHANNRLHSLISIII